jgi:hypothetical protein
MIGVANVSTVSTCIFRLRGSLALVLAILGGQAPSVALAADGPIADPKLWCGNAAEMIADKNTEGFIDSFVFASGRLIDRPTVEQVFASLAPALAREGEALGHDFLLQKDYGDVLSRVWYLVQFENGLIFLRCEAAKRGNGWLVFSVNYDSRSDNVSLP